MSSAAETNGTSAAVAAVSPAQSHATASAGGHEADWEQFQAFVAEVESNDRTVSDDDAEQEQDDGRAQDAEQSLENMTYVDRYRQALEQATATTGREEIMEDEKANGTKRERSGRDGVNEALDGGKTEDVSAIVRAAALESAKRRKVQREFIEISDGESKGSGRDSDSDSDSDSDALDLSDWRSKRIA